MKNISKEDLKMNKGRSRRKHENGFYKYMRRTYKNKLCAIAMLCIGIFSTYILKEASGLLFISIVAIPLFFAKDNWIVE